MRKLIPFDKYEAALLIEAVVRVENGDLLRQKAVEELSAALRRRALDGGIQISESFRSVVGISSQFSLVSQMLYGKGVDDYRRTKMFDKMIDMFRSNRAEFDMILKEAKLSCEERGKKQFIQRLSKKVSDRRVKKYLASLAIVDKFAKAGNLCDRSIYTLSDSSVVDKIMKTVASNRFRLGISKKKMRSYREAGRLLGEFVRGRYDQTIVAMPKTTVASPIIEKSVTPQVSIIFSDYESRFAQHNGKKTLTAWAKIVNLPASQNVNEVLPKICALALEDIEKFACRRGFFQRNRTIQLNKDMPTVNFDVSISINN